MPSVDRHGSSDRELHQAGAWALAKTKILDAGSFAAGTMTVACGSGVLAATPSIRCNGRSAIRSSEQAIRYAMRSPPACEMSLHDFVWTLLIGTNQVPALCARFFFF